MNGGAELPVGYIIITHFKGQRDCRPHRLGWVGGGGRASVLMRRGTVHEGEMESAVGGEARDGGQKERRQLEEFRMEAKWQRLHSKYYGSKSGRQQVHLTPPLPSTPPHPTVQPISGGGGDKIGSRRTRGVWMQSLQVRTQLLNCHFSPAASGALTLHTSTNSTPGCRAPRRVPAGGSVEHTHCSVTLWSRSYSNRVPSGCFYQSCSVWIQFSLLALHVSGHSGASCVSTTTGTVPNPNTAIKTGKCRTTSRRTVIGRRRRIQTIPDKSSKGKI